METQDIQLLKAYLLNLVIPATATEEQLKFITKQAHNYILLNKKLYRCNFDSYQHRLVLNKSEAIEALYSIHLHPLGGHLAYNNTLNKIAARYYWPAMNKDVKKYVEECPRCQRHKRKSLNERLHPVAVLHEPFEQIALDVKHVSTSRGGYRYLIVAICYITKYVEARAVKYQTAAEIALFLYEEIICRHGCPKLCITDNGTPMVSELVYQVCLQFSMRHNTISFYNSKANGLVERWNRTFDMIMSRRSLEEKHDWHYYLPSVLFAYRSMKQATTKETPFYLLYGYQPKTPFDSKKTQDSTTEIEFDAMIKQRVEKQIKTLQLIRKNALKKIESSQKAQKEAIDKKLVQTKKLLKPGFAVGDLVERYRDYKGTNWAGKLEDRWEGLYTVVEDLRKGNYVIEGKNKDDKIVKRIIHGNKLKIYNVPDVAWRLNEQYKRTKMEQLLNSEKEKESSSMTNSPDLTQGLQIQGLSRKTDILSRLGPLNETLPQEQSDKETVVSFEDYDSELLEPKVILEEEQNFQLNLLDVNVLETCLLQDEIKTDFAEFETRVKIIETERSRNEYLLRRIAQNFVRICNMRSEVPKTILEYQLYANLRGATIGTMAGTSCSTRKSARTLRLKNLIKRLDPYENWADQEKFRL